jgi:hypothetical protein
MKYIRPADLNCQTLNAFSCKKINAVALTFRLSFGQNCAKNQYKKPGAIELLTSRGAETI